jgi:hypothetical protein
VRCSAEKKRQRKEGLIMRKIMLLVVVLLMATSALARVDIYATADGNEVTVYYNATAGAPRAFALDINVPADVNIDTYSGANSDYWVYPGSIDINESGVIESYGSPIASPTFPGTLTGLGSSGITVEMGSLYPEGDPAPDSNGVLLKFKVSDGGCVNIDENTIRGGIVMENPATGADPNISGVCVELGICDHCGDFTNNAGTGAPDGVVNIGDLNALLTQIAIQYPAFDPTGIYLLDLSGKPVEWEACADVANTSGQTGAGKPDGVVDIGDVNAYLTQVAILYPAFDPTGFYVLPDFPACDGP